MTALLARLTEKLGGGPCLVQPTGTHGGEVMYFGWVCFRSEFFLMEEFVLLNKIQQKDIKT